jgi:hypothetical protein
MESSLIIIPKSRENEACPIYEGSWLDWAVAGTRQYGNPIWRSKYDVEYLIILTDKADLIQNEIIIPTSQYHSYGWDEINEE